MKRLVILSASVLFVVLAVGVFWVLTAHGFSARERPSAIEAFLARHARRIATPSDARNRKNPQAKTELAIAEGRDHFADHCAICHANDGSGRTQINSGLYPPAPDMRKAVTQDLSDGEIFYIIKNGVRFTGMPGWGGEDDENWKLVLFIRRLPALSSREIDLMKEVNNLELPDATHPGQQNGHHH
ncbi:MAG TPA: c-type cytochrome [Candidatus Binatia bacterium]|jgi:mono/diheme cytochrome c family protein|nr:c-type cytochrome [Candidatus Binatia bacterium]